MFAGWRRLLMFALMAAVSPVTAADDYPAPVQAVVEQGVRIEAQFEAPGGATGYVGRLREQPVVLYLLADGEHVVVGTMIDGLGRNLSEMHVDRYLPPPDLEPAWRALESATWVAEGGRQPKRIVYVITDPNCPYCHRFWENAQVYLDDTIQLRHVLVGRIAPTSAAKTARILASPDPVAALATQVRPVDAGGLEPLEPIPPDLKRKIDANNALMDRLGVHVTPAVFYRDREGRVRHIEGLPDDTALAEEVFRPAR